MRLRSRPPAFAPILCAGLLVLPFNALWPEDVHLRNGTVVRGTIVRQSRDTIEVSTTDGRRLSLNKTDVARIRYHDGDRARKAARDRERQARQRKERSALQARLASEARKAEKLRAAQEQRKAEDLRAAEEQRKAEELRAAEERRKTEELRAAEERRKTEELRAAEERRKTEELRAAESKNNREGSERTSPGTWLEPYVSLGGGAYGSIIGQLATVRSRAEDAASLVSNSGVVTVDTPDEVTYNDLWSMNLGIRAGRNRWLGEADLRTFSSNASYGHLHSDSRGTSIRLFGTQPFSQKQLTVQGGYTLLRFPTGSLFALGGLRWTQARTAIQEIGVSIPNVALESVSLGTTMSIDGWGPQAGLDWQMQVPRWPIRLSVRGSLFRMSVTGALQDAVLMPPGAASPQDSALVIMGESIMSWTGQQLSVRTSYRFANTIEAFLEIESTQTRSTVTKTTGTAWFVTPGSGIYPAPMEALSAALRSSVASSGRAEYFSGVRLGVTRRFDL